MFKVFDESPSRRADCERLVSATAADYPMKFCAHRANHMAQNNRNH